MSNFLKEIWDSSWGLPRRFGITDQEPDNQRRFFSEEARELQDCSAMLEFHDGAHALNRFGDIHTYLANEAAKEAFDAIYTAFGILQSHGIIYEEFENWARIKLAENDAKTPENGYGLVNGKVKKL